MRPISLFSPLPHRADGSERPARFQAVPNAFTLVELLVVMAVILLIVGLSTSAFNGVGASRSVTTAAFDIAGTLEQGRAYAMANRTYVWVGFYEEDGSKPPTQPATPGVGRVVICVAASKDGSRYKDTKVDQDYPKPFGANDPTNPVALVQLNKLIRLDNLHLAAANAGRNGTNSPERPNVDADYQVGDPADTAPPNAGPFSKHYYTSFSGGGGGTPATTANPTTFSYPVGAAPGTAQYTFAKIIEFNPQGEASKIVDGITSGHPTWMEIAVVPARGSIVDPLYQGAANATRSAAVVQVGGLNGRVRLFRP